MKRVVAAVVVGVLVSSSLGSNVLAHTEEEMRGVCTNLVKTIKQLQVRETMADFNSAVTLSRVYEAFQCASVLLNIPSEEQEQGSH